MRSATEKNITRISLLVGLVLWLGFAWKFDREDRLDFEPNIACINGSPYGKILVLVMQGSINVYFHEGARHEDQMYLSEDKEVAHDHEDCDHEGCDHESHNQEVHDHENCDHEGCDHDSHDAKVVKNEVHEHGEDCGCEVHSPSERVAATGGPPLHQRAKRYIKRLEAYTHRKTDGYVLTPAHKKYIQGVIEDKLRFAYELDPSNYTNYEGYYLYLTTSNLGRSGADYEAAIALAKRTLDYCKREEVDPFVLLTGAAAAHDIGYCMSVNPELYTMADVTQSLSDYKYCLKKYESLLVNSADNGFTFSAEKFEKMDEQARLLMTRFRAQQVYLPRAIKEKSPAK